MGVGRTESSNPLNTRVAPLETSPYPQVHSKVIINITKEIIVIFITWETPGALETCVRNWDRKEDQIYCNLLQVTISQYKMFRKGTFLGTESRLEGVRG